MLAIGAFAGVREAEIKRLNWSEVDQKHELIEIKSSKAKSARRRIIEMQPNLREWLRPYAELTGSVVYAGTADIWRLPGRVAIRNCQTGNNHGLIRADMEHTAVGVPIHSQAISSGARDCNPLIHQQFAVDQADGAGYCEVDRVFVICVHERLTQ
jgi:integrase